MKIKYSIHLLLAGFFLMSLLTFGILLGWFHHQKTSDIFLTSSKELFERVAEDVSDSFQAKYGPVSSTVRLLSLSPLTRDEDRSSRLTRLPVLISVLEAQPEIVAVSVGYHDAEYFIVRSLNSGYMLKRFGAPETAKYVVDNIEREDGRANFTRIFYDNNLTSLAEKNMGYTSYNPTVRPWYRLAVYNSDVTTTSPYLFYFIGKVGVTVVKEEVNSGNVFAADITLESLSNTLIRNRVSPSSQMLVYTSDNEVIASLEPDKIVTGADAESLSIATLSQFDNSVVKDFFQQPRLTNDSHFFLDSGGTRWIGINKPISLVGFTANLLILAPEAELLDEAYAMLNQSVVITVFIMLLSLPLALLAARQLAHPLEHLVNSTKPMLDFKFSEKICSGSKIIDLQQLESALDMTRKTTLGLSNSINLLDAQRPFAESLQQLTTDYLAMTKADGVFIYRYHHKGLVPAYFASQAGLKHHHNYPTLDTKDESSPFVKAFNDTVDPAQTFVLSKDSIDEAAAKDTLLNCLAAESLRVMVVTTHNDHGAKTGLLCFLFKTNPHADAALAPVTQDQQKFYLALGICCEKVFASAAPATESCETTDDTNNVTDRKL